MMVICDYVARHCSPFTLSLTYYSYFEALSTVTVLQCVFIVIVPFEFFEKKSRKKESAHSVCKEGLTVLEVHQNYYHQWSPNP